MNQEDDVRMCKETIESLEKNDMSVKNVDLALRIKTKLKKRKHKLEKEITKLSVQLNEVNYYLEKLDNLYKDEKNMSNEQILIN